MEEVTTEDHEDYDMAKPQQSVEPLREKNSHKIRLAWAREVIQDAEKYGTTDGMRR